jgi:hypothetical protein
MHEDWQTVATLKPFILVPGQQLASQTPYWLVGSYLMTLYQLHKLIMVESNEKMNTYGELESIWQKGIMVHAQAVSAFI